VLPRPLAGTRLGECTVSGYMLLGGGTAVVARNTSVSPGDHFAWFTDSQIETGRYGSASDVVRANLVV
jgi:hypothetical protein